MLIACWSAKGGSGTTVVTASLALSLAQGDGCLLVDMCGDVPSVLGISEPSGPGWADAASIGCEMPVDALARMEIPVRAGLGLLSSGTRAAASSVSNPGGLDALLALLGAEPRPVVVDVGVLNNAQAESVVAHCDRSLLVTRACYLALRRAASLGTRPHAVILVREAGRSLSAADVASVVGAPVVAEIDVDPAVARLVDAGLLANRMPRRMEVALRGAP